jgi:hypothetical protein
MNPWPEMSILSIISFSGTLLRRLRTAEYMERKQKRRGKYKTEKLP